jgi:hypothetical protein
MFEKFDEVLENRKKIRSSISVEGDESNLKQGFALAPVSPYSFSKTIRYFLGVVFGDKASVNECREATPGRVVPGYAVGVKHGVLNSTPNQASQGLKILVAGDVMLSSSGKSIQLDTSFLEKIKSTDVFVMNIESTVTF